MILKITKPDSYLGRSSTVNRIFGACFFSEMIESLMDGAIMLSGLAPTDNLPAFSRLFRPSRLVRPFAAAGVVSIELFALSIESGGLLGVVGVGGSASRSSFSSSGSITFIVGKKETV